MLLEREAVELYCFLCHRHDDFVNVPGLGLDHQKIKYVTL